ncbi:type 1 glutamine amidotransferase domain-containing protein [Xylanimonas protaetiae]|uniref:Type 1 glutamine amidotransferase domain-containing protein n=1 Tax=Xylanimonas protaetiae TaxID=2509457 RepID=A0A4P6F1T1_9MICO|nr:type 1 glutamine amidotransferase domain-containing protein [Xylanimonas protaetiae]QAY69095.1 type 1 glutamine amidotransferase domain-containing protein [Xylanimonas protaetiae]
MSTILFVVTSARTWTLSDGTEHPTGFWAEELLTPYRLLTAAGHRVAFATPGGVAPVVDEASLSPAAADAKAERSRLAAVPGLDAPLDVADVDIADYDALYYPGGHGPMQDLSSDAASGRLLVAALDGDVPLGIVCHGAAALVAATRPDGSAAVAGRRLTAFSDAEEKQAGLADFAPFLVESRLRELGADVDVADPWSDHHVVDGRLVSGQNPQSSASVARALAALLA